MIFNYKYLTKNELKGFHSYKYSAIDTSPLSKYVMHPLWNTVVKIIPSNIAPNTITFSGFLCMLIAVLLLMFYDYNCTAAGKPAGLDVVKSEIPNWVFLVCGVMVFLAHNLAVLFSLCFALMHAFDRERRNGIDGKQARKLGLSGPLGELFDHGLDSYVVFLIPYCLFSVFGRDEFSLPIFRGYLIIVSITLNFYICQAEKYNTGTLYLPWGYDVSMLVSALTFIVAGVNGPEYFKYHVFNNVTFAQALEVAIHCTGLLTTFPVVVYNLFLSYKNRTGKMYPIPEAIRPMWSIIAVTVVMTLWALKSTNDIIEHDPRAFLLLYGTLFSNIASRLIVCEMNGRRCEAVSWLTCVLAAGVSVSLYRPDLEISVLHILLLVAILAHVHYGVCVVRQISKYFGLNVFNVPAKRKLK